MNSPKNEWHELNQAQSTSASAPQTPILILQLSCELHALLLFFLDNAFLSDDVLKLLRLCCTWCCRQTIALTLDTTRSLELCSLCSLRWYGCLAKRPLHTADWSFCADSKRVALNSRSLGFRQWWCRRLVEWYASQTCGGCYSERSCWLLGWRVGVFNMCQGGVQEWSNSLWNWLVETKAGLAII